MSRVCLAVVVCAVAMSGVSARADAPPSGTFSSISLSHYSWACGVRTDATLTCWSTPYMLPANVTPPPGVFTAVSAGERFACALKPDETVTCFGNIPFGVPSAPPGTFSAVSAGPTYACGLRTDHSLSCWGNGDETVGVPGGSFAAVSTGASLACALDAAGALTCWGRGNGGTPPPGPLGAVSLGFDHSCALRADETIACWTDFSDSGTPPPGKFVAVSAGDDYSCAIRTDATLACWGLTADSSGKPPAGTFIAVSAGKLSGCGIRTDTSLVCWPDQSMPAATPTPSPGGSPAATTPPPAKPAPLIAAKVFTLPSARSCISRRHFRIRIHKVPGVTFVSAVVKLRGKRVKTLKGTRITAPIDLRGLPKGTYRVSITAKTSDGRSVSDARTYHTCASRHSARSA